MKESIFFCCAILFVNISFSQLHSDFVITDQVKTTSVKSQDLTNTCWSFATTSFIETEAIRSGKTEFDLSEMFFVYYSHLNKADDYTRLRGNLNYTDGGLAHDVTYIVKTHGLFPESAYSGLLNGSEIHDHFKMFLSLTSVLENAVENKDLQTSWYKSFKTVLDSCLGKIPETFLYKGKEYTSKGFNEEVIEFNPEDYIEITSYSHHPFYELIDLELPDNWSHNRYYNIPLNEFSEIMYSGIKSGYSFVWDGDDSEEGFDYNDGTAELSDEDLNMIKEFGYQEFRQKTFDDFSTTDDHLMHITGIAENKDGDIYYLTKNSWGTGNDYGGYLYMSEDFVKIKTVSIMIHKNAVPEKIAKKLSLK